MLASRLTSCRPAAVARHHPAALAVARAPIAARRASVVAHFGADVAPTDKQDMLNAVHRFFDRVNSDDHLVEDIVSEGVRFTDHTNEACYAGFKGLKHRLQAVHERLTLVETADVADAAHPAVAAHWVGKQTRPGAPKSGTFIFRFDAKGKIAEVTSYVDAAEDEFLEA